ncbi:MAG TPA: glycosyl hydrolase family 28-related protein [Tepidisphaeraceae bacterium]|nr:glycosyl hydrolase family 28-related protein [Tepidisphaeraceae bacterium]
MRRCVAILVLLPATLLAADLDVRSFGAKPDDGLDDTAAIQRALDAAAIRQVVRLPPGTIEISETLNPHDGQIVQGSTQLRWDGDHVVADTPTILKATQEVFVFSFHGAGLQLRNLSFQGRALYADRPNDEMVKAVVVDNCWIDLQLKTDDHSNAFELNTGLQDSQITNCVFDPIKADNAIYGYNWSNFTIAFNQFKNGNEGIHLIAHRKDAKDLLIEQNYFSGLHRMGVEIQGNGHNTVVQDNYYENPVMTSRFDDNNDTFAYSIISDASVGTRVRRNTSFAPQRPDGKGVRIIFELGGTDVICEDNYSRMGNHVAILNTSKFGKIINNRFSGYLEGPSAYPGRAIDAKIDNNTPYVPLTWDVNRGKPGPNKKLPTTRSAE